MVRFALSFAGRLLDKLIADDVLTLSAALSFYTLLSFAPLMVLAVWGTSLIGPGAQEAMLGQISALAGGDARMAAQAVIDSANKHPSLGSMAGAIGIGISLVGATTVFAQLQSSLNRIWGITAQPSSAILSWLRQRVLSVGVIAAIVFVLVVSLLASSALGMLLTRNGAWWDVINQVITTIVFAVLFALLFRYLPDTRLPWRRAAWGGLVTSALFAIGKWVIGFYLARGDVGGAYGAAGSLVVLLVWVYYSSAIFFIGAASVQVWLQVHGETIESANSAEPAEAR